MLGLKPPELEFRILCHLNHLTMLRRFFWPSLTYMCTKLHFISESGSLLKSLHWLPIKSHIKFKLNLLTYKALFMGTLSYLSDFLHFEKHQQTLRSESTKLLHPRSKRNYGHSSFVVAVPRLWNKLPLEIREEKSVTIF